MPKVIQDKSLVYQIENTVICNNVAADYIATKIELGYSIRDEVVARIKMIEYYLPPAANLATVFAQSADAFSFGVSQDPNVGQTQPSPAELGMLDYNMLQRDDFGTIGANAGNAMITHYPLVKNKQLIYPEGIVAHPASIYQWAYCEIAAGAQFNITVHIHYTIEDTDTKTYQALLNTLLINR